MREKGKLLLPVEDLKFRDPVLREWLCPLIVALSSFHTVSSRLLTRPVISDSGTQGWHHSETQCSGCHLPLPAPRHEESNRPGYRLGLPVKLACEKTARGMRLIHRIQKIGRRPPELPARKEVNMQVRYGFATFLTIVDHDAKSLVQSFLLGNFTCNEEQMPEYRLVIRCGLTNSWNEFFGNDEQMNGCLRSDIVDDDALLILMNFVCGNFPGNDFFKDGTHDKKLPGRPDPKRR